MPNARTLFSGLFLLLVAACDRTVPPTAVARVVPPDGARFSTAASTAARIAFATNRDGGVGNLEIYTMDADGSNPTRLTNTDAADRDPAQSPDGSKILFASTRDDGDLEIYVMNADGTGQTRLTNSPGSDVRPAWSPDGSKIAFTSDRDGDNEIYVMDADGTNVLKLTDNVGFDATPVWSPDGAKIAFASNRDGGDLEICVMNTDGSGQTNLTNNTATENDPTWTPNGRIGFTSNRDAVYSFVYVMDANGSNVEQLTNATTTDDQPAWSPDGAQIAFVRQGDVWVMNANGTNPVNITNNASLTISNENPDWGVPIAVPPPTADLAILGNAGRSTGRTFVYTIAAKNLGPDAASDVVLTSILPADARFVSVSTTQGSCSSPGVGSSGRVQCALGTIVNGGKVTTQITVKAIPANAKPSISAGVTSATLDPDPANSSATIAAP
jgi:uncharacterized repeat protein (TIGR01451 family)